MKNIHRKPTAQNATRDRTHRIQSSAIIGRPSGGSIMQKQYSVLVKSRSRNRALESAIPREPRNPIGQLLLPRSSRDNMKKTSRKTPRAEGRSPSTSEPNSDEVPAHA